MIPRGNPSNNLRDSTGSTCLLPRRNLNLKHDHNRCNLDGWRARSGGIASLPIARPKSEISFLGRSGVVGHHSDISHGSGSGTDRALRLESVGLDGIISPPQKFAFVACLHRLGRRRARLLSGVSLLSLHWNSGSRPSTTFGWVRGGKSGHHRTIRLGKPRAIRTQVRIDGKCHRKNTARHGFGQTG